MILQRIGRPLLLLLVLCFAMHTAFCQQRGSKKDFVSLQRAARHKIVHALPIFTFDYPDALSKCEHYPLNLQIQGHPEYYYRWYKDDVLTNNISSIYPLSVSGKYRGEISLDGITWVSTKSVQVTVVYLPDPQIIVDQTTHCGGSDAIFKSTIPTGDAYKLVWTRNGTELTEFDDKTIMHTSVKGNYILRVYGKADLCSNESAPYLLEFTPTPVFNFNYDDVVNACQGTSTTLKADGDLSYQYRWFKNGILTSDVTQSITVTTTGKYKVEASSCPDTWISSKEIQVNVTDLPQPVITHNKAFYCAGDVAQLNAGIATNAAYSITWQRDGSTLTAWQDIPAVTTDLPGNYTVIITSKKVGSCSINSANYQLVINPLPTINIQQTNASLLCDGQPLELKVVHSTGTVVWSTGETGDVVLATTSGNYSAVITSAAGCQAVDAIDLQFLPVASLADVRDTTFCTYTGAPVTLTAPSGFVKYNWNGQDGGPTYVVDHPQTVNLTAINENGCPTIKQIHVISSCPDIHIPSAFTPNGDGKNDTWNITGMETDASVLVKVFSRYGLPVFQSKGTGLAWNGMHNGNKVPVGVYYYIISGKNSQQLFSGSIALLN